ncbi:MAG: bifunctional 4-hydroxy-2-oxoglutarate aldolase/2-dehydro-3-deoxy-phosphogluconate aldolase, partial [Flavisolibacter sp.]|nr:bifunctional 4-hydroxy-2-oxoglutarate aldolase/2-dehydro-3-deoxy-phosphogluconate aldolase [Flavisolibacter sp.]
MMTLNQILENKIVAIIRGAQPDDVIKIAEALYEGGVKALEVTLNSPDALMVIETLSKKMEKELLIGAGTVLNALSAQSALSAGAKFIISPNLDTETIQVTKESGAVSIP